MVLPVGDDNPTRRAPVVTYALLAANIGVFLLLQPWAADACTQQRFFVNWAAVPDEVVTGQPLDASELAQTAPGCELAPTPDKNVLASVVSAMFLHAGWGHLLGNMLYLWIFGNNIEDRLGRMRYLLFYLTAGIVATLAFVVPNGTSTTTLVGASGAIAGVLGAYLVMFPTARVTVILPPLFFLPFRLPALLVLGSWFVLQLFAGDTVDMAGGGVAYLAHVAGFVAGAVIVLLFGFRPSRPPRGRGRRRAGYA